MAYLKIFPIKFTVKKAVSYITNPDKTKEQLLVSSYGCSPETAELEFAMTREAAKKMLYDRKNENLARHLIISFRPGEISDPQTAHEIGQKIADGILKGKHEYVLSTHVDKDHYHCHVIFNDVSFTDYHRFRSNKRSYQKMCMISNKICREYGLGENLSTGTKGRSYKENMEYKTGNSWKAKLKVSVDKAVWSSVSYEEFLQKMKNYGYEVRQGKYLAFRASDQKHFTNVKTLGSYYTEDNLLFRLEKNRHRAKQPRIQSGEIRLIIQMTSYISKGDYPGYDRFAKLNNLKEAAKTYNYLSSHKLLNYENFLSHVSDVESAVQANDQAIYSCEQALKKEQLIQKKCAAYRTCRGIITGEKDAPDKQIYRQKHAEEYKLHDTLLKELRDLGITKLPSQAKLDARIEEKKAEQKRFSAEKQELKKQTDTLQIVKSNFDLLLQQSGIREPEQVISNENISIQGTVLS